MAEVRLRFSKDVPPDAQRARLWTWETACRVAGVRAAVDATEVLCTVVQGDGGIPYESAFDQDGSCPPFPDLAAFTTAAPKADILGAASFVLLQREERAAARDDEGRGRALHADDCAQAGVYRTAWVDRLAGWIADRMAEQADKEGSLDARVLPWPRARPALAVTSDADEIRWSWRRKGLMALTRPWRFLADNAYWNVHSLAAELERRGMRGTFFLGFGQGHPRGLQYQAEEVAGDLVTLSDQGHEVGVHGSYPSYRDARLLARERERMERIVGRPVRSIRQHYLNFDLDVTWKAQAKAGFRIDSTAQVRGLNGFKTGTAHPYTPHGESILEMPPIAMDSYLLAAGRSVDDAVDELVTLWNEIKATGGVMVLNWHNEWFHTRDHPNYPTVLLRFLDHILVERPHTGTMAELATHWRRRNAVRLIPDKDGITLEVPERYKTDLAVELLGPWTIDAGLLVRGAERFAVTPGPRGRPVVELQDVEGTVRIEPA